MTRSWGTLIFSDTPSGFFAKRWNWRRRAPASGRYRSRMRSHLTQLSDLIPHSPPTHSHDITQSVQPRPATPNGMLSPCSETQGLGQVGSPFSPILEALSLRRYAFGATSYSWLFWRCFDDGGWISTNDQIDRIHFLAHSSEPGTFERKQVVLCE